MVSHQDSLQGGQERFNARNEHQETLSPEETENLNVLRNLRGRYRVSLAGHQYGQVFLAAQTLGHLVSFRLLSEGSNPNPMPQAFTGQGDG